MTGDQIKAARHSFAMSVSELADWLGLDGPRGRDLVRDWEKGKKQITGPAERAIRLGLFLFRSGQADALWANGEG